MEKKYLFLLVILNFVLFSCKDDLQGEFKLSDSNINSKRHFITQSGAYEGVNYTFKDLEVNPEIIKINSGEITLLSSKEEVSRGIFSFKIISDRLSDQIASGKILYIDLDDDIYVKKIQTVTKHGSVYKVEATSVQLRDIFRHGEFKVSIDAEKASKLMAKTSTNLSGRELNNNYMFNIIDLIKDYKFGTGTFNPNANVKGFFNLRMVFDSLSNSTKELEGVWDFSMKMKPVFKMNTSDNHKIYTHDMVTTISPTFLEDIKKLSIKIPIPTGSFLGTIPIVIGVGEVHFPATITSNLKSKSEVSFNVEGNVRLKFGYFEDVSSKKNYFIDESNVKTSEIEKSNLNGEMKTTIKVVVKPVIRLVSTEIFDVSGEIEAGLESIVIKKPNIPLVSLGIEFHSGKVYFTSFGKKLYTSNFLKGSKKIWEVGDFTVKLSNPKVRSAVFLRCDGLSNYGNEFIFDYKYPIGNRVFPREFEVSYDVYSDDGVLLESKKSEKITAKNITGQTLAFTLCLPYRKINLFSTAKTGSIKNLVIRDSNGFVATGVIDTKGNLMDKIIINR